MGSWEGAKENVRVDRGNSLVIQFLSRLTSPGAIITLWNPNLGIHVYYDI